MTSATRSSDVGLDHIRYLRRDFVRDLDPAALLWSRANERTVSIVRLHSVPRLERPDKQDDSAPARAP